MFTHYERTIYKPSQPVMIWDGDCAFCKYWITVWRQHTHNQVKYVPYQQVLTLVPEIPEKEFKKAARFIETDGLIYSGPDSAYKSLSYYQPPRNHWHKWYHSVSLFKWCSDYTYSFMAKNRPASFRITKLLWGSDPESQKPYWIGWVSMTVLIFLWLTFW